MKLRNSFRFGTIALLATAMLGISNAQAADITWRSSLSSAMTEAKKSGKPVLVDFSATWCGPCKQMKQTTFKDAKVIAESRKWVMVRVDIDDQEKVAEKYKITAVPTLLIMSPQGKVVAREVGGQNAGTFLKWMKSKYAAAKK